MPAHRHLTMVDQTSQLEDRLVQRHEAQQAELKQLQDVQFEPLKAQLDEMRAVHNLPRLPTLEHERNERQKRYAMSPSTLPFLL